MFISFVHFIYHFVWVCMSVYDSVCVWMHVYNKDNVMFRYDIIFNDFFIFVYMYTLLFLYFVFIVINYAYLINTQILFIL